MTEKLVRIKPLDFGNFDNFDNYYDFDNYHCATICTLK